MDKEELLIEIITEKLHEKSSDPNSNIDQRRAFILILKTLKQILDEQSEFLSKQEDLTSKIESFEELTINNNIALANQTSNKLEDLKKSIDTSVDNLNAIIANSQFWKKFWHKVLIFAAAIGTLAMLLTYLITFNILKIVWTIR